MNIKINTLTLTNFKCFRNKEFTFGKDIITIKGRNGVGKTTIFDAILFCLFGKNSQDQTKFNIKTNDENGNVIPHLDHAVEIELEISRTVIDKSVIDPSIPGDLVEETSTISLRHSVKEKWTKKRGATEEVFSGDTHEYFVNGELYTAADYKKYISSLIDEQTFRILTNPQYFTSLKWQEQRDVLIKMVGSIEPEVIANTEDLAALVRQLKDSDEDIIAYRKHLSYQIKKIKEQLEKIPVRLEEQNKALPEKLDWEDLQKKLSEAEANLKELDSKIAQLQQGNGADVKRTELRQQINATTAAIDKLRIEANNKANEALVAHNQKVSGYAIKFSEALNNQKLMEQTILADERLINRCGEIDFEAELQKLRDQWPSSKFVVDESAAICPTCGQPIPEEQYREKVEEMRKNFNLQREAKIKDLNERASVIKKTQAEAAEDKNRLEQKLTEDKAKLEEIKQNINDIFAEKAKVEKESVVTADEVLAKNSYYIELKEQQTQLKAALESVTDSDDETIMKIDIKAQRLVAYENFCNINNQLITKGQYDKIISLIDGINAEQKELVKQLAELERKEDVARQYEDRQNEILESRINEHFKITRWKMFRTVVNGGDSYNEPYCECYDLNGTAFHDGLNQAARLNIGLDIINTMCSIYNVSAPIIIDQSESTLDIQPTTGQQLRLCVFDSDLSVE